VLFSPLKRAMRKRGLSSFITEFSEADLAMENRRRVVMGLQQILNDLICVSVLRMKQKGCIIL
jgi:hypothetical protein